MMPFMETQCLGDAFEAAYKRIYAGGGADFGAILLHIVHMLDQLADAGLITNMTRKNIETFLIKDINLSEIKVISRNTNDIVLINTDIHEQDHFDLVEFISWITEKLCNDPIMKKTLCGRETYEGVKKAIDSYEEKNYKPLMKENWVDFYLCEDRVFYTKKDEDGIHLYVHKMDEEQLTFHRGTHKNKDMRLATERLINGRIYYFADDTIFVDSEYGYIIKITNINAGKCCYSRIGGTIINQLTDGSLLFIEDGKLIRLRSNGKRKVLVDNAALGMTCIEGNNVFWKSYFRKKDFEIGNKDLEDKFVIEKVTPCLNTGRICKEMLWKGLLFTLYNFDNMKFGNKMGNRLRFACFFDKLPIPFTMDEISKRLSKIEEYCYSGDIVKAEGYVEAMSFFMSCEEEEFDEKNTFDALVYLIDNVTVNPYKMIVNNAGTEVMTCIDFFFGDFDDIGEESINGKEIEGVPSAIGSFDFDAIIRNIDRKIAELEEEERKEKDASKKKKRKEQSNSKNIKDRQEKRKPVCHDESEIDRSAEGVMIPFDE
ncbi:MAG: hypothetical protein ACI4E1_07290 [Lachnospira sp.]